mgnify:CR=1 FL=1
MVSAMDSVREQIRQARRRLILQQFLAALPWSLLAALLAPAVAQAVPKLWALGVEPTAWTAWWVGGALGAGAIAAAVWTALARLDPLDAAVEIDRRFGLKERVSSAISLPPSERQTDMARALLEDAARRLEGLDIRDGFPVRVKRSAVLPLLPAMATLGIALFFEDAVRDKTDAASGRGKAKEQIQRSAQELQKRLEKRREEAEKKGLEDAADLFKKLHEGVDDLARKDNWDRRQALVKLNDLSLELAKRRDALGDPEKVRQQLERLKDIERGPAEKMLEALKRGDPGKAAEEIKRLREQLQSEQLSEAQRKQLAKQLQQIQRKMQEAAEAHQRAKEQLERQIRQKAFEGDLASAGKLQKQLDQLRAQDRQMDRLRGMASQFGEAQQALQRGDSQTASAQLDRLTDELGNLQAELDKIETLDELMNEISDAKSAMSCKECSGAGCKACMGDQFGPMGVTGEAAGDGLGEEGRGYGYRPEEKTATGAFETQVRAKPKAGEAIRIGEAFGPNQPGISLETVKDRIETLLKEEAEPLTDERLPRSQRDHVRQYYQRLGKGG